MDDYLDDLRADGWPFERKAEEPVSRNLGGHCHICGKPVGHNHIGKTCTPCLDKISLKAMNGSRALFPANRGRKNWHDYSAKSQART